MGVAIALLSVLGFLSCMIWFFISLFRRRSIKSPVIIMTAFFFIFLGGLALTPPSAEIATNIYDNPEEIQDKSTIDNYAEPSADEDINDSVGLEEQDPPETEEEIIDSSPAIASQLEVHFIDVGQGDSIYIKTPSQNILIDGGNRGNTALNYLRNQGVSSLDLMIGTHPHADHIGGLINVMQAIPVTEVIDPAVVHTTKTFEDYLDLIDQKDIKFSEGRAGMSRDLGGGTMMKILHPTAPSSSQLNDASVVVRLTFGEVSFLFTGDAEKGAEQAMLSRGVNLNSDILKVGHHGSRTSTTLPFLNAVSPSTAIIMCGKGNQYGHPHDETLSKLSGAGIDIYRTDLHGSIVITTDGIAYQIIKKPRTYQAQPQPPPPVVEPKDPPFMVAEGQFVGSKNSGKYPYPDCHHANNIKPGKRGRFSSVEEAAARQVMFPVKAVIHQGSKMKQQLFKNQHHSLHQRLHQLNTWAVKTPRFFIAPPDIMCKVFNLII
jgi:competence protein ComEC